MHDGFLAIFSSFSSALSAFVPSDQSMPLSVPPDIFTSPPSEELDGEDDDLETIAPSDPTDPLPYGGVDDVFVGLRSYVSGSNQFYSAQPIEQEGLRIVDSDSETDTDDQIVAIDDTPAFGNETDASLRWECLFLEENRRDLITDFEWEDVTDGVNEREILSLTAFLGDDEEDPSSMEDEEELDFERLNFEWEDLLAENNMGTRNGAESVPGEEGFDDASDYDVLFDQFVDHGVAEWTKYGRPAAKSVVESLSSIFLTAEDVTKNNTHCAICNDEISFTEKLKRLPCLHHYHEFCILPWLATRNTCPLCRYELPNNDASIEGAQVGTIL